MTRAGAILVSSSRASDSRLRRSRSRASYSQGELDDEHGQEDLVQQIERVAVSSLEPRIGLEAEDDCFREDNQEHEADEDRRFDDLPEPLRPGRSARGRNSPDGVGRLANRGRREDRLVVETQARLERQ